MSTSVGQGAVEVSDVKSFLVGVGTFPVSRMEEQAWEEVAREKPGLEKWFSGSVASGDFSSDSSPATGCAGTFGRRRGEGAGVCAGATYSSNLGIGVPEVEKE